MTSAYVAPDFNSGINSGIKPDLPVGISEHFCSKLSWVHPPSYGNPTNGAIA
jgi:hypothetical protein